ncbi:uncharacterized protein LOC128964559 [Oppia nitens]|uniref:uncharacterized protein LOC128964559 n=1 Tax=Oppia nitens TaxID=1686743 RepID=UPI0023DC3CBA|nr:uncharacterized protein LOC128964559 [Oppia nitens]
MSIRLAILVMTTLIFVINNNFCQINANSKIITTLICNDTETNMIKTLTCKWIINVTDIVTTTTLPTTTLPNMYPQDVGHRCPPTPVNGCNGPKDCLYVFPGDCTKYYQCNDGGQAFIMNCPIGTEWSDRSKICDFPYYANCSYN